MVWNLLVASCLGAIPYMNLFAWGLSRLIRELLFLLLILLLLLLGPIPYMNIFALKFSCLIRELLFLSLLLLLLGTRVVKADFLKAVREAVA